MQADHRTVTEHRHGGDKSRQMPPTEPNLRYAIYFTPPETDTLTETAAAWLGRDAFGRRTNSATGREALVEEPARYGFHATLKAPFHLKDGVTTENLVEAFEAFAESTPACEIDRLVLGQLGPFFALVPASGHEAAVNALAAACVKAFEPFRAPLGEADIARRKPEKLPEKQRQYLTEWGYPYVFDEFRFHMTLTAAVAEADREAVRATLETHFSGFVDRPLAVGHVALFIEPRRGAPFNVLSIRQLNISHAGKAD